MILIETKVSGSRAKDISDRLPFDGAFHANNFGFSCGIWVLWDSTQVDLSFLSSIEQEIHSIVKDFSTNSSLLLSTIYASPRYAERRLLWDNLSDDVGNNTTSESHVPRTIANGTCTTKGNNLAESTGVVPAKHPPKVKLVLFSLL